MSIYMLELECLSNFVEKVFSCDNRELLNSELDYLDSLDINQPQFDNLKYLIIRSNIAQHTLKDENEIIDITDTFDLNNPPNPNSIRYAFYLSHCICEKILNRKVVPKINYIADTKLNINKLYNYFIYLLNNDLISKLIKWLDDLDWDAYETTTRTQGCDDLKLLKSHDVDTIFNETGEIYKTYYDYPTNPNIYIKDSYDDKYFYIEKSRLVENSIYDDLDMNLNDIDENENENEIYETNETKTMPMPMTNIGGTFDSTELNIIGVHELPNNLGLIISTVPICKLANLIQHMRVSI
jgi:hypothetical protein